MRVQRRVLNFLTNPSVAGLDGNSLCRALLLTLLGLLFVAGSGRTEGLSSCLPHRAIAY